MVCFTGIVKDNELELLRRQLLVIATTSLANTQSYARDVARKLFIFLVWLVIEGRRGPEERQVQLASVVDLAQKILH